VGDPVASGIVARFDRPSGNTTGFAIYEATLGGKWLELLSEIAPGLKRAAIMFNTDTATVSVYMPSFETAARSLKVELITAPVHGDLEIETAITALGREPGGGLVVLPDGFMTTHRAPIILAAARNDVAAVYSQSYFGFLAANPWECRHFREHPKSQWRDRCGWLGKQPGSNRSPPQNSLLAGKRTGNDED
jgi:putative ABC transport system substrate-binding protein